MLVLYAARAHSNIYNNNNNIPTGTVHSNNEFDLNLNHTVATSAFIWVS